MSSVHGLPIGIFTRSKNIFKNGDEKWLETFFGWRKGLTKTSSSYLMSFVLPLILMIAWTLVLIITLILL
jgi:hypothetical protein